jgi:hypothetical protein
MAQFCATRMSYVSDTYAYTGLAGGSCARSWRFI